MKELKAIENIQSEANLMFGEMREATNEERESIEIGIKRISKKTGINFWDELENIKIKNDVFNK